MVEVALQMEMVLVLQTKMEMVLVFQTKMEVRLLQEHPLLLEAVLMSHPTLQPQQEQWQVR